ncbi:MAG: STAS/SEC14 domain-containing protein [Pirellulaceae bacterium]|nr:STAS/SEC14 domain-containing protein [Pirellulaceae bacterium]
MLEVLTAADNIVEVALRGNIRSHDFAPIRRHIDDLIAKYGAIRLLLDASEFDGWQDVEAAKAHFRFIQEHHHRVERIAVVGNRQWQYWLAAVVGVFLHSEMRCFANEQQEEARRWLDEIE